MFSTTAMPAIYGTVKGPSVQAILSAHFIHMMLLADFAYYYVRAFLNGNIAGCIAIGEDFV
eukprot:CAMPEP_0203955594 /NCGR_PEP_ID=MMETSP0359-20131031/88190_1 /ASSEMBLY_ACC=CAM_ASM_000338 /TAXON_ID=268821 /ORGANISM="Scrippsiella Hangoei, Strain SHTV-5" /LENGTH=60 /DNA_ID=CAMNT_0050889237 /DNA_START=117 /DNA_END=299 /DNA_ORIENTATION=-